MADIQLENETLKAAFSPETGALLSLTSKQTGWDIHARRELGLSFKMHVPIPDRRNNFVLGEQQKLVGSHVDPDNAKLVLTWDSPQSQHAGALDIGVKGTVSLTSNGLTFEATVDNRSPYVVESVSWPCLGDLSLSPGASRLTRINIFNGRTDVESLYPIFRNQQGYHGIDGAIQNVFTPRTPFVLVDSGTEGLYAGYHDTTAEHMVQFTWELKPGYDYVEARFGGGQVGIVPSRVEVAGQLVRTEFYATHFPFLRPGESGVLHPVVLQPYVGSWHNGADSYKSWRGQNLPSPRMPDWAKGVHSWQLIHINSPEDDLWCQYRDLVKYGEDCAKHGVAAIQLSGWTVGGQDRGNPSHDIEPRLGTWEELRDAIAAIHEMGVKVVLFNKYTWADQAEEWFRTELVRHAAKDPYGDYNVLQGYRYQTPTHLADINTRRLIAMCPSFAEWRTIAEVEFGKGLALGAAGMLYDECQHHGAVRYCFDAGHGHHVPAHIFSGDGPLAEGFRRVAAERDPDYLFAGEACFDLQLRHYSVSYFRIGQEHIPLHRYVNPDAGMMIAVTGYNDRNTINQALLYRYIISYEPRNMKGRLDEFPDTLEYGKSVDALRERYSEYLWGAEFRGTVGAEVKAGGKPYGSYSVFISHESGKKAVVVVNTEREKRIQVRAEIDDSSSQLLSATAVVPSAVETDGSADLEPLSAVVFMEQ